MEEKKFTLQDVVEAMESGKNEGWKEGYLAAKLGIDWVEHYDDEDWKKIVKGFIEVARKERKTYEKRYKLPALSALLDIAYENYQETLKKEETRRRSLTLDDVLYNLGYPGVTTQIDEQIWSEES